MSSEYRWVKPRDKSKGIWIGRESEARKKMPPSSSSYSPSHSSRRGPPPSSYAPTEVTATPSRVSRRQQGPPSAYAAHASRMQPQYQDDAGPPRASSRSRSHSQAPPPAYGGHDTVHRRSSSRAPPAHGDAEMPRGRSSSRAPAAHGDAGKLPVRPSSRAPPAHGDAGMPPRRSSSRAPPAHGDAGMPRGRSSSHAPSHAPSHRPRASSRDPRGREVVPYTPARGERVRPEVQQHPSRPYQTVERVPPRARGGGTCPERNEISGRSELRPPRRESGRAPSHAMSGSTLVPEHRGGRGRAPSVALSERSLRPQDSASNFGGRRAVAPRAPSHAPPSRNKRCKCPGIVTNTINIYTQGGCPNCGK